MSGWCMSNIFVKSLQTTCAYILIYGHTRYMEGACPVCGSTQMEVCPHGPEAHRYSPPCGCHESPSAPWSRCFKDRLPPAWHPVCSGQWACRRGWNHQKLQEKGGEGAMEWESRAVAWIEQPFSVGRASDPHIQEPSTCSHPSSYTLPSSMALMSISGRMVTRWGWGGHMGRILCQSLMNNDAWLPCVFSIMWPEASGGRTVGSLLTIRETGQAPGGMGLCTHMKLTLNRYPATDNPVKSWTHKVWVSPAVKWAL